MSDQHASSPTPPGLARRALSYAEAVARWMSAGRPERSPDEIERLFQAHCQSCGWYDTTRQICRGCGCRTVTTGWSIRNKLAMATEHCPRGLW